MHREVARQFLASRGAGGWLRRAVISRVIALHSVNARSRERVACHVPAAGEATSANQKYGGPPRRSRDLAVSFPSGAISESSPSSGSSAAKTTRKGAPFQGAIGEDKTATSAALAQLLPGFSACKSDTEKTTTKNALATSNDAVTAAENWRARNNCALPDRKQATLGKLNHGKNLIRRRSLRVK